MKNTIKILLTLASFIMLYSCNLEDNILEDQIEISILNNQDETFTSMKIDVALIYEGESEIIEHGIVWSTNSTPTIEDDKTIATTNTFTSLITNLTVNTTYYFRAYVTNGNGTTYSEVKSFQTLSFYETTWKVTTTYYNGYEIDSRIDFFQDNTY